MLNQKDDSQVSFHATLSALLEEQFNSLLQAGLDKVSSGSINTYIDMSLSTLLSKAGVSESEWSECINLAESDERFAFLRTLEQPVAVAVVVANAYELSLFGNVGKVGEYIIPSTQAFIRVLDGLIDDVPELFDLEKENILSTLQHGLSDLEVGREEPHDHIVINLLNKIILLWTRSVRSTPGFSDPSIRMTFIQAVNKAMNAEYYSANCIIDGYPSNVNKILDSVREKSTNVAWVIALIPIIARGWPHDLDINKYHQAARLFGIFVGWIDDIFDVLEDLDQNRWSEALLELYLFSCESSATTLGVTKNDLMNLLSNAECRAHLVEIGVDHQISFFKMLNETGADPKPIANLVAEGAVKIFKEYA